MPEEFKNKIMTQDEFIEELKERNRLLNVHEEIAHNYFKEKIEIIEMGPKTLKNENEFRQLARLSKISNESAQYVLELLDEYFNKPQQ